MGWGGPPLVAVVAWLLVIGCQAPVNACARGTTPIELGFSLGFTTVNVEKAATCMLRPSRPSTAAEVAITSADDSISLHYLMPDVRKRTQDVLSTMARQGAIGLRTHVWYRHAEDAAMVERMGRVNDPLGLLVAQSGRLPAGSIDNLIGYLSDAAQLGYRRAVIVASAQGTANPKCRRGGWGACYDSSLDGASWKVVEQLVSAIAARKPEGLEVSIDISPEGCFDPNSPALVERNLESYTRFMVTNYSRRFGDRNFLVSCAAARAQRVLPQLIALRALYAETGTIPASVDVHIYEKDPGGILRILAGSEDLSRVLGVPLDVNETYSDHQTFFNLLMNTPTSLRGLMVFPRELVSHCQINVAAPYPIAQIRHAINGEGACRPVPPYLQMPP
jgi:hypothetical protein